MGLARAAPGSSSGSAGVSATDSGEGDLEGIGVVDPEEDFSRPLQTEPYSHEILQGCATSGFVSNNPRNLWSNSLGLDNKG